MKKSITIIVFVLLTALQFNAQKIEINKVFGGYQFTQNDKTLTLSQMQDIMKENKEAFALVQSAKANQTWAMILGAAGGGLIGFPIGTAIGGGDPEWALAGAGAALIVATIPIVKGFNRKTKKAVDLYNATYYTSNYQFKPSFNLNIKGTSLGLSMTF